MGRNKNKKQEEETRSKVACRFNCWEGEFKVQEYYRWLLTILYINDFSHASANFKEVLKIIGRIVTLIL